MSKNKIKNLVEMLVEEFLEEAKIDKIIASNPDYSLILDYFRDLKPKYLDWVLKQFKKANATNEKIETFHEDTLNQFVEYVKNLINDFDKLSPFIKNKDINAYKNTSDLEKTINQAFKSKERKEKEKQVKEEKDVIYEDDKYFVMEPKSEGSACYYGKGTRWCISATEDENYFDDYYSQGARFIFVIDKQENDKDAFVYYPAFLDKGMLLFEIYDAPDVKQNLMYFVKKYPSNLVSKIQQHIGTTFKPLYAEKNVEVLESNNKLTINYMDRYDKVVYFIEKNPLKVLRYVFDTDDEPKEIKVFKLIEDLNEKVINIISEWSDLSVEKEIGKDFIENIFSFTLRSEDLHTIIRMLAKKPEFANKNINIFQEKLNDKIAEINKDVFQPLYTIHELEDPTEIENYRNKVNNMANTIMPLVRLKRNFSNYDKSTGRRNKMVGLYKQTIQNFLEKLIESWDSFYKKEAFINKDYMENFVQSPFYRITQELPFARISYFISNLKEEI